MKRLRWLTCLVLSLYVPIVLSGCAAMHFSMNFHAELNVPGLGTIKVSITLDNQGQQVFKLTNPTESDACVQPKDANGNNIGGPLELPAGGSVNLPPGADSDKSEVVKKPPKPKPVDQQPVPNGLSKLTAAQQLTAIAIQPLTTWPGFLTSFSVTGQSKVSEYSIAARDAAGAFAALDKLDQGLTVSNAELVARTEFIPSSATTAQFSTTMPTKQISQFDVYVNGVLVASSATGLGGATIVYSANGYGQGTASIPFDFSQTSAVVQWVTTSNIGATTSRSYSFSL